MGLIFCIVHLIFQITIWFLRIKRNWIYVLSTIEFLFIIESESVQKEQQPRRMGQILNNDLFDTCIQTRKNSLRANCFLYFIFQFNTSIIFQRLTIFSQEWGFLEHWSGTLLLKPQKHRTGTRTGSILLTIGLGSSVTTILQVYR